MFNKEEEKIICKKAIENFGEVIQMITAIEKLNGLAQTISKALLIKNLYNATIEENTIKSLLNEQMADVEIMLEQLKNIKYYKPEIKDFWKEEKLKNIERHVW